MIVLGAGGTAGLLTLCALRQQLGSNGEIIAIEYNEKAVADILDLGVSDVVVQGDATHPIELVEQVYDACSNADYQADLTINPYTPDCQCTPQRLMDALLKELPAEHPPLLMLYQV